MLKRTSLWFAILMLTPLMVSAMTPVVDTTIAVDKTGSEPFDTTTWTGDGTGGGGINAGTDADEDNNVVRLQDSITYKVEVSVNDSDVEDLVSTVTLNEKQKWITIPSGCKTDPADVGSQPVSTISADGTTLTCNLGPAIEGTTRVFFPAARAVGSDPVTGAVTRNDDIVTAGVSSTAYSAANGQSVAAIDGPTEVIVTGFFRVDLKKQLKSTATDPDTGAPLYRAPTKDGITGRDGSIIEYTILASYVKGSLLADGDLDTTAGGPPGVASYRIVDVLTDDNIHNDTPTLSTGATLYTWDPNQPACELLGDHGAGASVTCTQLAAAIDDVGPGATGPDGLNDLVVQIDLANIDVTDPDNDANLFEIRLNIWFDKVNDIDSHQVCNEGMQPECVNTTTNRVGFWDGSKTVLDPFDEDFDTDAFNNPGIQSTEDAAGNNVGNYNMGMEPFPNEISYPLSTTTPGSWVAHKAFTSLFPYNLTKFPDQNMAAGETRPYLTNIFDYRKIDQAESQICDKIDTQVFEYGGVAPPNQIGVPALYSWNQNREWNPVMSTFGGPNGTTLGDGSALVEFYFTNRAYTADPIANQAGYITELRTATCDDDLNGDSVVVFKDLNGNLVDENGDPALKADGLTPADDGDIDWWRDATMVPPLGGGAGDVVNVTRVRQDSIYDAALANAQDPTHERFAVAVNHLITAKLIASSPYGSNNRLPNFASFNRQEADGSYIGWRHVAVGTEDPDADATFSIQPGTADRMTLIPSSHSIEKYTEPRGIKVVRGGDTVEFIVEGKVFGLWNPSDTTATINDNLPSGTAYVAGSEMFSPDGGATWYTRDQWDAEFAAGNVDVMITSAAHTAGADPLIWSFDSLESANGTTMLTSDQLPLIKYSVFVDPARVSGRFVNVARINSGNIGGDQKQARYQITILPEFGVDVLKQVNEPVYGVNQQFEFDLVYKNLGGEDYSAGEFIDILPYNGDNAPTTGGVNSSRDPGSDFNGTYEIASIVRSNGETFFATNVDPATIEEDPCHVSNQPAGYTPPVPPAAPDICSLTYIQNGNALPGGAAGTGVTVWTACSSLNPLTCGALTREEITALRFAAPSLPAAEGGQTVTLRFSPTGNIGGEPNLVDGQVTAAATGDIYTNTFGGRVGEISLNIISNDVSVTLVAGSIGDTIWYDLDADGNGPVGAGDESDTAEPYAEGVEVALLDSLGNPVYVDPDTGAIVPATYAGGMNPPIPYVATTDAMGQYLFENLPAATYTVVVTPPAGAVQTYDADDGLGATDNRSTHDLQPVLDGAGQLIGIEDNTEQDFGYSPPLQVGSTVFIDSDNDGLQAGPTELGIPGVTVQLFAAGADPLTAMPVDQTVTDMNGDYLLNTGTAGDYFVYIPVAPTDYTLSSSVTDNTEEVDGNDDGIQAAGGDPISSGIINLAYGTEPTGAAETVGPTGDQDSFDGPLDSNGDMTVDFGFYPTGSIGDTVFVDLNANGYEPGEAGISGVTVTLTYTDLDGVLQTVPQVTAGDGSYLFEDLPLDVMYTVEVNTSTLPGTFGNPGDMGVSIIHASDPTGDPNAADNISEVTLTAAMPDNLDQDFGYRPVGSLGDTVWYDANNNGIQEAGEDGIPGVTVTLTYTDPVNGPQTEVMMTGPDGEYLFEGLVEGIDYTVTVDTATLPNTSYMQTYDADGLTTANTSTVMLALDNSDPMNPIVVGNLDQDFGYVEPVSIGGYVWEDLNADGIQDAGEPAIAGSTVSLLQFDETAGEFVPATGLDGATLVAPITVGANGQYIFDELLEGDYKVQITSPIGFQPAPMQNGADDDDTANDSNIDLAADGSDNQAGSIPADTYESGIFTLVGGGEPTGVDENEVGDDQDDAGNGVARDESGNMTVDFAFVRPLSVGSLVWVDANNNGAQDADETPLAGATVSLLQFNDTIGSYVPATDINGDPVADLVTGANGEYKFTNLAEGDYKVQVTPPEGFIPADDQNPADDNAESDSNINLAADGADNAAGSIPAGTYESGAFELAYGEEPQESGAALGDGQDGSAGSGADRNGNMTIDFGFREPELGSIGNFIWLDENSDGLQDAGEPGIAGVTVVLYDAAGNEVARTETDADGGYLFADLPADTYYVDVLDGTDTTSDTLPQAGMTQTTPGANAGADFGNQDHATTTVPNTALTGYQVVLGEGEHNPTADFGYNYNPDTDVNGNTNLSALGDTIWVDSDGDGIQDHNEVPVSGAVVSLFTDPDGDGVFDTPYDENPTQTTDENGQYLFDELPAGAYVVTVTDSSGASHDILNSADYLQTGDPDHFAADATNADAGEAGDNSSTSPIVLSPGDVFLNADFGYQPLATGGAALGSIGDTIWLDLDADGSGPLIASIDGVENPSNAQGDDSGTADAAETGISGVSVALVMDTDGNGVADPGEPIIATVLTDDNGQYLFADIAYGDYVVQVTDTENKLIGLQQSYDADGVAASQDSSAVTIGAADPDVRDQDFGYSPSMPTGSIGDTVWADIDSSADSQANQGSEPGIAGVTVNLYAVDAAGNPIDTNGDGLLDAADAVATTTTDAAGGYLFDELPLGDYVVEVDDSTLPTGFTDGATYLTGADDTGPGAGDLSAVVSLTAATPYNRDQDFSYPPDGTTATIGDLLWGDTDGDGLGPDNGTTADDLAEPPLAGVTVKLFDDSGALVATTTTGNDGRYSFTGLNPAATYMVEVDTSTLPAGYLPNPTGDPEMDGDSRSTIDLSLGDGNNDPDGANGVNNGQDFGYPPSATPTGSIGDTVWFDVDNSADDQSNQGVEPGIAGVRVTLYTDPNGDGDPEDGSIVEVQSTDENGNYLFQGLPLDANYVVVVNNATLPNYVSPTPSFDPDGGADSSSAVNLTAAMPNAIDQDFSYPPVADTGIIGDTIFIDNAEQTPVEGVVVNLLDENGNVIATTTTNADGSYLFVGLDPNATYGVQVDPVNFAPDGPLEGTTNSVDPDGSNDNVSVVDLSATPDGINLDQDFGYTADTPVNVGNLVWLDVNADGVYDPAGADGVAGTDDDETLIAGVTLDIYRDLNGNGVVDPGEPLMGQTTTSDTITTTAGDDGNYLFAGLPADTYVIKVTDEDEVLNGYWHSEGAPGVTDNSQADAYAVDATAGDNLTADFGYYKEPGAVGDVVWEDLDGDGVYDPATEPGIDGVVVTLTLTYPDGSVSQVSTVTEFGGKYEFDNLLLDEDFNGIAEISYGSGGDEPTHLVALDQTTTPTALGAIYENQGANTDSTEVGGGATDNDDLDVGGDDGVNGEPAFPPMGGIDPTNDFGFAETASLGNRVWMDLDMDGIQDANEDGLANVTVNLLDDAGNVVATTTTGPDGGYLFKDLDPGVPYRVMVDSSTIPAGLVQTFDEGPGGGAGVLDHTSDPVTLTPGEEHLTADFGYAPPAGVGAIGDRIWVDTDGDGVQDPGETGLGGVMVSITPPPDVDLGAGLGQPVTMTTDSNGNYLFVNLPLDETYVVEVNRATVPPEYADVPGGLGDPDVRDGNSTAADDQTTVVLTAQSPVNLDADFGYLPNDPAVNNAIGGTIWNDDDSDGNGPAGAGDESDGSELPFAGVTVTLLDASGNPVATTTTGPDGSYLFTGLPDGSYTVMVTDANNVLGSLSETVDFDGIATPGLSTVAVAGGETNLEQDFGYVDETPTGGSGDGSIGDTVFFDQDGSGTPDAGEGIEGVTVQLIGPGPDGILGNGDDVLVASTTTDVNGNYLFNDLDTSDNGPNPGTDYQVVIVTSSLPNGGAGWSNTTDPDGADEHVSVVTLTDATPSDLDQDFGYQSNDGNSLSGTVWPDTDGNGEQDETGSFDGVTVELRDQNGNVIQTTATDANGDYSFTNLPDGIYTVVVTDEDNVLNGFAHTDSPNGTSDTGDQTSKDDTGYTVDLDSAGLSATPVSDVTGDFGYQPVVTNPISLGSFSSTVDDEGALHITWVTQTEVANLGFNIYGRVNGEWVQLNDKLVLSQGDSVALQTYQLTLTADADMLSLSDIDLEGKETLHGPFLIGQTHGVVGERRGIDWSAEKATRKAQRERRKQLREAQQRQRERVRKQRFKMTEDTSMQFNEAWYVKPLAAVLAAVIPAANAAQSNGDAGEDVVNLLTQESGIHQLSHADLLAGGIDLEGAPVADIALLSGGDAVQIQVQGSSADAATFGAGGWIRFVAQQLDTLYTDTNVYTLRLDQADALRVSVSSPALPSGASANAYLATAKYAPQAKYSFVSPDQSDPWYAKRVVAVGESEVDSVTLQLKDVAAGGNTGSTTAKLSVNVWGSTDLPGNEDDHHVRVRVNGADVTSGRFDGLNAIQLTAPLASVNDGYNRVTLELPLDTGQPFDAVNVNEIAIHYPRQFIAENNRLSFKSNFNKFTLRGFSSDAVSTGTGGQDLVVMRDTGIELSLIDNARAACRSTCAVQFGGGGGVAEYHVAAVSALPVPAMEPLPLEQDIDSGQAAYLIISHPDFIGASNLLEDLAADLAVDFGSADIVDVEAIYAQYGDHVFDPTAIQRYIKYAADNRGTQMVLLVGGDVYDYRQFENEDAESFIPSLYAATGNNITFAPVDAKYVDLDDDNVPDLPIGRLPVRTTTQLAALLSKRTAFLDRSYQGKALLVADEYDVLQQYDFAADADEIDTDYLQAWSSSKVYVDQVLAAGGSVAQARSEVVTKINQGQSLTAFFGHSSTNQWAFSGLFTGNDAAGLSNIGKPTVVTQWGCWNAYYVSPSEDSMGHRFMMEGEQGAVAVMGASTLTNADAERRLARKVFERLSNGERLGEAITNAKQEYAQNYPNDLDVLLGWTLLGLPELIIN